MDDFLRQLDELETDAERKNSAGLQPFLEITDQLINIIPTIVEFTKLPEFDLPRILQHIFLKQTVTSLRTVSKLLIQGYSPQAAMIACSMYELDLYSTYIGNDPARAEKYRHHTNSQDWVWPPHVIIKEIAETRLKRQGIAPEHQALTQAKQDVDGAYVFLCSIKHSNPLPLLRHTVTTTVDDVEPGRANYTFGIFPDSRPEDEIVKKVILSEANQRTISVANNTANTAPEISEQQAHWISQLTEIQTRQLSIYQGLANLGPEMPFRTIRRIDTKVSKPASKA